MPQHVHDFRDPGVLVHSNKSAETLLVKWSPVRMGSVRQFEVGCFVPAGFSCADTPHGSGSWQVCIPLSASAHVNRELPVVCVRESNRMPAAHRGRSIRDWL